MSRALRWCFTLNNYTPEDEQVLLALPDIKYMIYGHETAPETGTPHLQGFIVFETRKYMNWIKNNTSPRIHLEIARGSVSQNISYCSKGEDIREVGEVPYEQWELANKSNSQKWDKARRAAKAGAFDEIPSDLWIKYRKSWEQEYQDERINKQCTFSDLQNHFIWIWGETGTGKSFAARSIATRICPEEPPYLKEINKWWTGYRGQKVVIIEEIQPDLPQPLIGMMKKWFDKWEFACETKGGQFQSIRPPYIIVTSNYSIEDIFTNVRDCEAIKRRFFIAEKKTKNQEINWPSEIDTDSIDSTLVDSPISHVSQTQIMGRRDDVHGNTNHGRRRSRSRSPEVHDYPSSQEY